MIKLLTRIFGCWWGDHDYVIVEVTAFGPVYKCQDCGKIDDRQYYGCNCTVHDITVPGAAHAVDCPMFD